MSAVVGQTDVHPESLVTTVEGRSPRQIFWARFRQDKWALAGGIVVVILLLLAVFAGVIARHIIGHPPNEVYDAMTDEFGIPKGPNSSFWFGADSAGRDLFVRVLYGARTSLLVAFIATTISMTDRRHGRRHRGLLPRLRRHGRLARQRHRAGDAGAAARDRHRRRLRSDRGGLPRRARPAGSRRS